MLPDICNGHYAIAVKEFVLPGTLADVWRDLHTMG